MNVLFKTDTNTLFNGDVVEGDFLGARVICPKCNADVLAQQGLCSGRLQQIMNQQQKDKDFLMFCPRCGERLTLGGVIDATDAKIEIVEEKKDVQNGSDGTDTKTTVES